MQSQGYPPNLFVKTVLPSELFCAICTNVMRDPVTCLSCKIWLCLGCTTNACNYGNEKHSYSPINKFIKSKIDEYQVKCRYSTQGCLKILKINTIDKHEEICEFVKASEKNKPIPGEISEFNCTNCPTSNYKCPTCKKQMLMTERKNHDCLKWLLEFQSILEKENQTLVEKNSQILKENERKEKEHQIFIEKTNGDINDTKNDSENKIKEIAELKKEIEYRKKTKEEQILIKMREFYEFSDSKNQKLQEKNEKERENLFRRINNCTLDYLDSVKKGLFDFNCKVQADATDLSTVPIDMKEYDRSPLRNFTNVGPASVYKK